MDLSLGYASSPSIADPETIQKTIPKPRIILATIYIPTSKTLAWIRVDQAEVVIPCCEKHWRTAPTHWKADPMKIDQRRPNLWATQGTTGTAKIAPRLYAAEIIPSNSPAMAYVGFPVASVDNSPKSKLVSEKLLCSTLRPYICSRPG